MNARTARTTTRRHHTIGEPTAGAASSALERRRAARLHREVVHPGSRRRPEVVGAGRSVQLNLGAAAGGGGGIEPPGLLDEPGAGSIRLQVGLDGVRGRHGGDADVLVGGEQGGLGGVGEVAVLHEDGEYCRLADHPVGVAAVGEKHSQDPGVGEAAPTDVREVGERGGDLLVQQSPEPCRVTSRCGVVASAVATLAGALGRPANQRRLPDLAAVGGTDAADVDTDAVAAPSVLLPGSSRGGGAPRWRRRRVAVSLEVDAYIEASKIWPAEIAELGRSCWARR